MHDKDSGVAIRAMDGLAWAFSKRVSSKWALKQRETWCSWVPDMLLQTAHYSASYSNEDALNLSFTRLTLLDQAIFGKGVDSDGRARIIAQVWQNCGSRAQDELVHLVFSQRQATQRDVLQALRERTPKV